MRINTNISAINTQRNLNSIQSSLAKSVEKLSSGLRINRAGDDAAGLSISEKLRAQTKGLNQAVRNAQDGISMIQTAEGGLNETHSILQRMRELSVQASNDTLDVNDRKAIGTELDALKQEIDRISTTTQFNSKVLLNGGMSTSLNAVTGNNGVGDTLGANNGNAIIQAIDVTGAAANTTFTFGNGTAANSLKLSATINGQLVTQEITPAAMVVNTASATQTLNFNQLGIKVTLSGVATAANIQAGLTGDTLTTSNASASANFQVGAFAGQQMAVVFDAAGTGSTLTTGSKFGQTANAADLATIVSNFKTSGSVQDAQYLMASLDQAIKDVSVNRATLGAAQNRLEHTIENLATSSENLTASESRIRDADMAAEMVGFTRSNILQQAGTSILAQANQLPQGVLSLLR